MVSHDSILRGLGGATRSAPPLVLQRTDENVVGVLLESLETEQAYAAVADSRANARTSDGVLRLFQPVHRTFHVVVMELACDRPGHPRLDPTKIDSAGFVVRRIAKNGLSDGSFPQGWLSVAKKLRGWSRLEDPDRDPDPLRRKVAHGGSPELARKALEKARLEDGAEHVTDLFVAPPSVCERAGKTLLFGLIPTVSSEMSEAAAPPITADAFDVASGEKDAFKDAVLPVYLKAGGGVSFGSLASRYFTGRSAAQYGYYEDGASAEQSLLATDPREPAQPLPTLIANELDRKRLDLFIDFLRFLRVSLDVWGDSAESVALSRLLAEVRLPYSVLEAELGQGVPADQVLRAAAEALIARAPGGSKVFRFPVRWPVISSALAERIYKQVKATLAARLSELQPGVPRFEEPSARYVLRAFARIKRADGCPPELVWSDESEPYVIVPWYENGVLPPMQIQLPDITSESVRALRPNVAFKMPRRLFNFLNENSPQDLLEGKAKEGLDVGLQWICGFNISIIFVLAFIVMFMFLLILNIVFWWLPFIRICFPLPSFSKREDS